MQKYSGARIPKFMPSMGWCASTSLLAALAVQVLSTGVRAAGEPQSPAGDPWAESAGLQVFLSDSLDAAARIFDSPDFQQTLIVPGDGDAFVLSLKERVVRSVPRGDVHWTEAEEPFFLTSGAGEVVASFTHDQGIIAFDAPSYHVDVRPEPPLVGEVTLEKLRAAKPDYVLAAEKYVPDAKSIAALQKVSGPIEVEVFFGTWCSYCKHWLPPFLKTVELMGAEKVSLRFFGMSEDLSEPADALSLRDVSKTPTFVVLRDGKEIGRIEEEPLVSVEADFLRILNGK